MTTRKENSNLSADVVKYLVLKGYKQKDIAECLDVDSSFISHVIKGHRNLTIDHLEKLAEEREVTVPELLAIATPVEAVPRKLREGYKLFLKGLQDLSKWRSGLERHALREREPVAVGG